jgi:hypothetical protein
MMTADQKFLKDAGIARCEIAEPRWMAWRDEECEKLRNVVSEMHSWLGGERARGDMWKLLAFSGWFLAAILFMIPLIERIP